MNSLAPLSVDDVSRAFTGKIKRPRVGIFYTVGLLLVTVVMAILPLIYLALIGLVVYATYYHTTHNYTILSGPGRSGRVMMFKMVVYGTPIFMGSVLSFFMVKPLLARRMDSHQPYALNPEAEPVLYEFIRKICEQVGAPMPSLIELDSRVNAAAGFRYGFKSFLSNELTLHIGLSLLAGVSARELGGVIAHEFGHFTQALAMRLGYIIDRIDMWFARVIYERDSWDAWLEEMAAEAEDGYTAVIVAFARLGVWFSRLILKALMYFGHAISCFLSRQMEFHADQFSIRLAGSAAHESMLARLDELNALSTAAFKQMRTVWNLNKRLPDNLPQFVVNQGQTDVGAQVRKAMKENLGFVKTGWFHTHPSDADRAREARAAAAAGVLDLDRPATDLFQNFSAVGKIVSQLYYEDIELPVGMVNFFEVGAPSRIAGGEEEAASDPGPAAIDRFLFGVVTPLRPIFPKAHSLSESEFASALGTINALPQQINQIAEQVARACAEFDEADRKMISLAAAGDDFTPAQEEREQARRSLRVVIDACEERLGLALSLGGNLQPRCQLIGRMANPLSQLDAVRTMIARAETDAVFQGAISKLDESLRAVPCAVPERRGNDLEWAQTLVELAGESYMRMLGELTLAAEKAIENPTPRKVIRVGAAAVK